MIKNSGQNNAGNAIAIVFRQYNHQSFTSLYYHYAPTLSGTIQRITGSPEQSATILHRSFLSIWKNKKSSNETRKIALTYQHGTGILSWERINTDNTLLQNIIPDQIKGNVTNELSLHFCISLYERRITLRDASGKLNATKAR